MKTLLLLRHAKSSWKDLDVTDHERPLNKRGKNDSTRMGHWLKEQNLLPERIIASSAKRTRKTAARLAKAAEYRGVIELAGELYLAHPSAYLDVLRQVDDYTQRLLMVGHNPGIEELLCQLAGQHHPMPTAALAHLRLPMASWSELTSETTAELVDFWRAKQLPSH